MFSCRESMADAKVFICRMVNIFAARVIEKYHCPSLLTRFTLLVEWGLHPRFYACFRPNTAEPPRNVRFDLTPVKPYTLTDVGHPNQRGCGLPPGNPAPGKCSALEANRDRKSVV